MNVWRQELQIYLERNLAGDYLTDEPLAVHTWYRIGGPADFFVYPRDPDDVIALLQRCRSLEIPFYIIGAGANMLVSDAGFRGVVINLTRYFTQISQSEQMLSVSAGVLLNAVILYCEAHNLGGLHGLSGVPGTVGGALTMNAGTHRGEIGDMVCEVSFVNDQLEVRPLPKSQIAFGYRSAPELQGKLLLGCQLQLYPEEQAALRQIRLTQLAERAAKQPLEYPSCGSVFKRPSGYYVGKMVEELGLKGVRYGDAMISEKHGGFIINLGQAKASQVIYLIEKIKDAVYQRYQVELESEVRLLGF